MMDLGSMVLATKAAMTTPNYDPWQVRFPGGFAPGQASEAQSEAHGGFWSKTHLLNFREMFGLDHPILLLANIMTFEPISIPLGFMKGGKGM